MGLGHLSRSLPSGLLCPKINHRSLCRIVLGSGGEAQPWGVTVTVPGHPTAGCALSGAIQREEGVSVPWHAALQVAFWTWKARGWCCWHSFTLLCSPVPVQIQDKMQVWEQRSQKATKLAAAVCPPKSFSRSVGQPWKHAWDAHRSWMQLWASRLPAAISFKNKSKKGESSRAACSNTNRKVRAAGKPPARRAGKAGGTRGAGRSGDTATL